MIPAAKSPEYSNSSPVTVLQNGTITLPRTTGLESTGLGAIRAWVERTTAQYHATVEPQSATDASGESIVSGLVSGDFEGSPVLLDHAFTLTGQKISRLEIS